MKSSEYSQNVFLKHFEPNDWAEYRNIRLEALSKNPHFFSPSRDETQFTEEDWRQRLQNKNSCTFGLYHEGQLIGLTGIVRDKDIREKAHLIMSYIREDFRKNGYSSLYYNARIAWAREQGDIRELVVDHNEDNLPSRKAHQKFGFSHLESFEEKRKDGRVVRIETYHLILF